MFPGTTLRETQMIQSAEMGEVPGALKIPCHVELARRANHERSTLHQNAEIGVCQALPIQLADVCWKTRRIQSKVRGRVSCQGSFLLVQVEEYRDFKAAL